ncbi:HEAT repeat domain-containing protein [Gimesia aquarii]|uniref:HEAT repeat protein n=1 Tax=Gimesia aquarii TaxID=2527964 RepID=A0A517WNB2_9PLAN|nr:HEAT repeat domain-containing protein [Gimesia aquarii]QDU06749.1 hypothetical protein V202x_00920 [Gimesia aquarii]
MLAFIHKTTFFPFLISVAFLLNGCGGSNSNNQRSAKSNPFAPSNGNFAPARPRTPNRSNTERTQQSPDENSNIISQQKTGSVKKITKPKVNATSNQTNIITETRKRTLDSKSPGVAIIVRGVSGDEPMALPILQKEIRSSILNPSTNNLQKQGALTESSQQDFENFVFNKQLVVVVRPVPNDLFAFAQKLNWGKVKEIDLQNRIITVDTQLQQLNSTLLKNKAAAMQSEPPVKVSANTNSVKNNATENPTRPMMKTPEKKPGNSNDRDLKPRSGEETIDWALRVIAGSSPFAHDTACKQLARMTPDDSQLQRVSSVLAATLPLAKEGFRMKEHVNAMAVWYTKEATMAFAVLLADEKSVLVREEIIELLPKIHSETTAEVLVGRLSNREDLKDARQALKIMGQIAEKPVIRLLNHPNSSLRIEACKILQSIGTQEAVEALKIRAEVEESNVVKQLLSETQAGIQSKLSKPEK